MKRIITPFLLFSATTIRLLAQDGEPSVSISAPSSIQSNTIEIELRRSKTGTPKNHRTPIHIELSALYDIESSTINVISTIIESGEVYLYLDGVLVAYDSQLNTSFSIYESGIYRLEIHGSSWIAQGEIVL